MTTSGILKSVSGSTLVVTDDAGKDTSFTCDGQTKVTLNGDPSSLGGLVHGSKLKVVTDGAKVKSVDATS